MSLVVFNLVGQMPNGAEGKKGIKITDTSKVIS
jgi:hypothetical protein